MAAKSKGGAPLKKGGLTDEEKRKIESMIDISTFADIGRAINRNPHTVRKYCQRNALSKDLTSKKKFTENRAKHNHHLIVMQQQLTKQEYEFAVQIYKGMMDQFGNDIIYSEEVQIIEYCMITCLLNRAFSREMELSTAMKEQKKIRADWQKKKDDLANVVIKDDEDGDEEDKEAEKYELEDYYLDKMEQIDLRIADMQTEYMQVKKDQINFLDRKENITKALNVSRRDRAQEITKVNQNFGDLIMFMKKNEDFRKSIGLEIERMRLGIKEEYLRLSELHLFADNVEDYPVLNTEVITRQTND
jgi:hypothetical protein